MAKNKKNSTTKRKNQGKIYVLSQATAREIMRTLGITKGQERYCEDILVNTGAFKESDRDPRLRRVKPKMMS